MHVMTNLFKVINDPKKSIKILLHRLFSLFGHYKYRRFIVLTRDRTGSNMTIQSLNSHPNIAADYELFGKLEGRQEQDILRRCFSKQPFYVKAKGFKIFYYHPRDQENSTIWSLLEDDKDLYIIHLIRRNTLHSQVSCKIAVTTGVFGVRSEKQNTSYQNNVPNISFEPKKLEETFIRDQQWQNEACKRFKDHPMLEIYYEDVVATPQREYGKIMAFLGLNYHPTSTDFIKQRTKCMSELVENYDVLKKNFKGTQWEDFFDE